MSEVQDRTFAVDFLELYKKIDLWYTLPMFERQKQEMQRTGIYQSIDQVDENNKHHEGLRDRILHERRRSDHEL
jgi:hypothetical protein